MNLKMRSPFITFGKLGLIVVTLNIFVSDVSTFPAGTTDTTGSWTEIEVTELPAVFDSGTEVDIITITDRNNEIELIPETTTLPIVVSENDKEEEGTTTTYVYKDQEEILNELQNIWYYTEGLNDDQNDLKSSLSSLVHMTYARVYEIEPNETLTRLKFLLRKLRSRLLQEVEDSTSADLASITTEISITPNSNLKNNTAMTASLPMRKKRSYEKYTNIATFENANSDENSLFSDRTDSFYQRLAELKRNHSIALRASASNTTNQKFIQVEDKIPLKVSAESRETEVEETTQNPFGMELSSTSGTEDLVFVTTTPGELLKPSQADDKIAFSHEDPMETPPVSSTVDDIVQSIIEVLKYPAKYQMSTSTPSNPFKRPYPTISVQLYKPTKPLHNDMDNDINGNSHTTEKGAHDLPSYLTNLVEFSYPAIASNKPKANSTWSLFKQNNKNDTIKDDMNASNTTEASMSSTTPQFAEAIAEEVATEILTSPTNMMNQTFERIILAASAMANLSSASRMVLLFATAISILSIALGVYSLGPPMVAVGVLGILVPVLVLLLFQSSRLKRRKSVKQDIMENVSLDDVKKILELIAEAVEKYN